MRRAISISPLIDEDSLESSFKDGILRISFKTNDPKPKNKTIEVK